MRRSIFYIFLTGVFVSGMQAQDLESLVSTDFHNLTVEDGLSQNSVNCIMKDSQGFLWFGTRSGLDRYNSYDIQHISSQAVGGEDFSNAEVTDLLEDRSGAIWIATISGLFCYDPRQESVEPCRSFPEEMSVHCLEAENDSLIWIGTSEGLFLYKANQGIIEEYTHKPYQTNSLSNSIVYTLENDGDILWIGTHNGLNRFHKESRSFNHFFHSERPNSLAGNRIRSLLRARDGRLWIGTEYGGISSLEPGGSTFSTLTMDNSVLPHNDIRDIEESRDGKLWLATNGSGLCQLDPQTGSITIMKHDPANPMSLSNNSTYSVLEDREGILWVGTFASGVNYATAEPGVFRHIYHQPGNPNTLCESKIRSIYQDRESRLWIGTWGGMSILDPESLKFSNYYSSKNDNKGLSFNTTVTSFLEDSRGRVWIGTYSGGLNLFHEESGTFTHYLHDENDPNTLSSNQVFCIAEDLQQNIWIATDAGLNRFDEVSGSFEVYNDINTRDINVVPNGNLILAITGGVALFNIETHSIRFFEPGQLSTYQLNFVIRAEDGGIWFGTQGGGMGKLFFDDRDPLLYTVNDGLPSNHVSAGIPVGDSIIWLSTYKGISRFNSRTGEFRNFGLADGLPGFEFFPRSAVRLPNGDLAFGSSRGLVFFNPDSVSGLEFNPEVILSSLKINNNPAPIMEKGSPLTRSLPFTKSIDLKHSEKDFMLEFVALNFRNPGKNNYAYILENYVDEWRRIGDNRSVGFTNLDPGEYIFRVRSFKEDAVPETLNEASLRINIHPPVWGTWWFRITAFLMLSTLTFILYRISAIARQRKRMLTLQKMEYEKQEKFVNMKLRFFSNISHEFRTPLTLILDPLEQMIREEEDPVKIKRLGMMEGSTRRLAKLIDQILDFRRVEADALKLQVRQIEMISCFRGIFDSFEEMAATNGIEYRMDCDHEKLIGWLDDDKVEKILYNVLANAFKFTPSGGSILLKVYTDPQDASFINFSVHDSGSGISKEKIHLIFERFYTDQRASKVSRAGAGIGLAIVKKMVELHRGSVEVESAKGEGTTFTFTIPYASAYYTEEERIDAIARDISEMVPSLAEEEKEPESVEEANANLPLVLVVEDDKDIREYLEDILGRHFEVRTAANGKEGLNLLEDVTPELILSDTIMPEMDGIEFCKAVKNEDHLMMVPFIFLSVWSSDDFKLKGLHTGADDYITKPFNSEVLLAKIQNIIEARRRLNAAIDSKIDITPNRVHLDSTQTIFVKKVQEVLEENISDPDFNSKSFREKMNMSHSLLYRNLKSLTGLSSNELIRDYRLKRAAQILKMKTGLSISEIGFKVGFVDSKYFSQCFKKKYKLTPSEYLIQEGTDSDGAGEQIAGLNEQFINPA